jgi:CheY-like chemotaxis protein
VAARILLVEDDFLVAMVMERDVLDSGFEVAGTARSAEEAVMLARQSRPDLVVMDVRLMGSRDGVDAALQILNETGIRCVFATANADAQTRARAAPARPLAWLQKPYGSAALLATLNAALDGLQSP